MAKKVIAVEMTLDTTGVESGLGKVEDGLKGIDEQIENINEDAKLSPFEKQLSDLDKRVESGSMTMREMSKAVKEYQTIAVQAGKDSPIGQAAILQAAQLKDSLGDLQTQVSNLGHDGRNMQAALQLGSTVIGGYSAFQGITAALGVENEELAQTFVKLQAAQSALAGIEQIRANLEKESFLMLKAKTIQTNIMTGAQTAYTAVVGTSTGALKLFKLALVATGIGAIIVLIGLLIANFEKVTEVVGNAARALMAWFGFIDVEQQKAEAATKKQTAELRKQTQQRIDDIYKAMDAEKKAEGIRQTQYDLEIARLDAEGKSSRELTQQKLNDALEYSKFVLEQNKLLVQSYIDYYKRQAELRGQSEEEFKASMKSQGIDLDLLQKQSEEALQKFEDNVFSAETDLISFRNESKKGATVPVDFKFPEPEELEKLTGDAIQMLHDYWNRDKPILVVDDFEIEAEDLLPEEEVEVALGKIEEFFIKLKAYRETGSENIRAELEESLKQSQAIAQQALETLESFNELANQIGENRIKKIEEQKKRELRTHGLTEKQKYDIELKAAKAVDEIRLRQFKREKALNIAKATMDTAAGVTKALATVPFPANFVVAGLVGVAGAAQIATIAAQKFDSSASALTPPDFSSAAGAQESGSDQANNTNANPNQGGYTETSGLITKVIVTENDITKVVNNVAKINAISTIGG